MNVTIMADASHCHRSLAGGYGFWIASQRGKKGGGGPIAVRVENNNTAEMMAVCHALYEAIKEGLVQQGDHVLIQTDCLGAIHRLNGSHPCKTKQERLSSTYFKSLRKKLMLTVDLRHVKGHSLNPEKRFVANNMCDIRAKEGMREARRLLQYAKDIENAKSASVHPA